jgi:hypothetical protein
MKTLAAFCVFMTVTTAAVAADPTAAKPAVDHSSLAASYQAAADKNDAQGAAYEKAAATYRHHPLSRNVMSPTTPGRYESMAKQYREKAMADRQLAASHAQMAKSSAGL